MISDYCHGDKVKKPKNEEEKNLTNLVRSTASSSKTMLPNEATSLRRSKATVM